MITTTIRFPVESIRKLETFAGDVAREYYIIVANAKEIAHQFDAWRFPELQNLDVSDSVSQAIKKTLCEEPREFFYRNRGLKLVASQVSYEKKDHYDIERPSVALEFADPNLHGLIDGGHTYQAICNYMDELSAEAKLGYRAYVRLEVFEGITDKDVIQDLIYAFNFSPARLAN